MTRIRCPQTRCLNWDAGLCAAAEIELDIETLTCMTFEDAGPPLIDLGDELDEDDELEWDDDESIFEEDLDESLYGKDEEDDDDGELDLLDDDDDDGDDAWGY